MSIINIDNYKSKNDYKNEKFLNDLNKKVNNPLKIVLGSEEVKIVSDWEPPKTHGLSNSERIIPEHYINNIEDFKKKKIKDLIIDDVRNFRKLDSRKLNYIKYFSTNDEKIEIITEYDKAIESISYLI